MFTTMDEITKGGTGLGRQCTLKAGFMFGSNILGTSVLLGRT
jgi:hypothetical protein